VASWLRGLFRTQLWCQKRVCFPFPTSILIPYLINLTLLKIPCLAFETLVFSRNISISHLPLQYLNLNTLDQRLSCSVSTRQPSFIIKAVFTCLMDLRPRPLLFTLCDSFPADIMDFPLFSIAAHKKLRFFLSTSSHSERGSLAVCIAK